jgi:glycerol-3-phosphate dehydrogenase
MTQRATLLAQLPARRFDLLVIGGGIVGAGIARDAAMRGLAVALIEQGDFASGTSSKTSKLIHGGLRYLEHGQWRLVFESLRERQTLRTIVPAFVHPLTLLLPIYGGSARGAWSVQLGLSLYDLLAWRRAIRPHRMLSAHRALAIEPSLRVDGLRAAGLYADCMMDDARLCLANILQAMSFGAVCCNYVRLREFLTVDQRLCGGLVEDVLTGRSYEVQARVVVNATGPWSDRVRQLSEPGAATRLSPTKGIHLIVRRVAEHALFVEARRDRRMCFVLPWGEYSLVGTTEGPISDSLERLSANENEVGYLLEELNRILPGGHVSEEDIIATYAGARPLLAFEGSATHATREHRIAVDQRGLISILGGKYTTYRVMAQDVVDLVLRTSRSKAQRCLTDQVSLLDTMHPVLLDHWRQVTRRVDPDLLARLITRYGTAAFHILQHLDRDASLGQPVCPHHEYIVAELLHGFQEELACTITDVLARRTRIAWSSCQGLDLLSTLTGLLRDHLGLPASTVHEHVEDYHQFLMMGQMFRPLLVASTSWSQPSE